MSSILTGYTTQATAYEVKDYPYGYTLRTSIFYWIESKAKHGDRLCTYTINPKTGKANKPKYGTYYPFLYMYLNEQGHVTTGIIDPYNMENFRLRFGFITNKIGEVYLSDVQKTNIRNLYYAHVAGNAPYSTVKYTYEKRPVFVQWVKNTLKYIRTCPFAELVDHDEEPEQDNPNGEIKVTVTERPEAPALPVHNITVEVVTDILTKTLPGFTVSVSPYKGFAGDYLAIQMAASANKTQMVSLSLNLKDLDLHPQGYSGQGGQAIYRDADTNNPKERFLAMKSERVFFRTPAKNEKDVLRAIELFAVNYKATLIKFAPVLKYRDTIDYAALLNLKTA